MANFSAEEWILNNSRVIDKNFKIINNSLNNNFAPAVKAIQKFITEQKLKNLEFAFFMIGVGIYICCNEKRHRKQDAKVYNLRKEINKMKGEQVMKWLTFYGFRPDAGNEA